MKRANWFLTSVGRLICVAATVMHGLIGIVIAQAVREGIAIFAVMVRSALPRFPRWRADMNTFYLSFGSVKVGERFRFVNPYIPADAQDWTYRKVSPRKYRCECGPNAGRDYQTSGRVAVAIVYED